MGFFDKISSAFKRAEDKVSHAFKSAGSAISSGFHSVVDAGKSIVDTGKSAVTTVYNDAKGVVIGVNDDIKQINSTVGNTANNVINTAGGAIEGVEKTIGSLSLPLLIGAGVLGLYVIIMSASIIAKDITTNAVDSALCGAFYLLGDKVINKKELDVRKGLLSAGSNFAADSVTQWVLPHLQSDNSQFIQTTEHTLLNPVISGGLFCVGNKVLKYEDVNTYSFLQQVGSSILASYTSQPVREMIRKIREKNRKEGCTAQLNAVILINIPPVYFHA
ncbi:hypothetical protein PPL_06615 [Heterostelium album PN500]|uniref:Uncharacterized protein n=1 Tax=Heterostelium pallidum (strain ATCC 26659 / Pp 5 / PN500) TaxID=670386 RepID=D3BF82_HETP5|nr:hypothetical protein PPL_06615 [Heterostelium album PN500]EFA79796.1 hypothetical protein PPL_06615 [Heterostelium album PN500]|eukprot:XP_020431917.1 hypothetical protein PPL_06615 [Heterostelium album PN500]